MVPQVNVSATPSESKNKEELEGFSSIYTCEEKRRSVAINHVAFSSPETVVFAVVRLPRDLVVDGTGVIAKSESLGVIDIEAPVSITIGNSLLWHNVKIIGGKDSLSLYWFREC